MTDLLVEHFTEFVDYDFTARMEDDLDQVAEGKRDWVPMLHEFYDPFAKLVEQKKTELKRADFTTEETDEVCSEGHPMVIRLGRTGRFLACSKYPEHKETRPLPGDEPEAVAIEGVGETCPECGEGTLVAKARPVRAVRRLLALSRLQVHPQDRPAAARSAAVRGDLSQVQRGPPHGAASATDGLRLLWLLALSQVRLHLVARADGRRCMTRTTDRSRARARAAASA